MSARVSDETRAAQSKESGCKSPRSSLQRDPDLSTSPLSADLPNSSPPKSSDESLYVSCLIRRGSCLTRREGCAATSIYDRPGKVKGKHLVSPSNTSRCFSYTLSDNSSTFSTNSLLYSQQCGESVSSPRCSASSSATAWTTKTRCGRGSARCWSSRSSGWLFRLTEDMRRKKGWKRESNLTSS